MIFFFTDFYGKSKRPLQLYHVLTTIQRLIIVTGGRERTNERTNEFFINEGKGISTIYFFSSSPRAKKQNNNNNKKQQKESKTK